MDNYGSSHFDVDTFGGDEFGGEEQSETQYLSTFRDSTLFLVDCTESMFIKQDNEDVTWFEKCMKAIEVMYQHKIYGSDRDFLGIVFFGTEKNNTGDDFPHIFTLQDLEQPSAERIKQIEKLSTSFDMKSFKKEYGHSTEFALDKVLWWCSNMFSAVTQRLDSKRIMMFTGSERPHERKPTLEKLALNKAKDLNDVGIALHIVPFVEAGKTFDYFKFYGELLMLSEEQIKALPKPAETFEELEKSTRSKDHKRRPYTHLKLSLSNDLGISCSVYNLVRECPKPSKVKLDLKTNVETKSVTRRFVPETGEILFPSDTKLAIDVFDKRITFEQDEIKTIKRFGNTGLELIGFKSLTHLKPYMYIKPGHFLYPDEKEIEGSTTLFRALLEKCLEKEKFILCKMIPRVNTPPRLVALVAQKEEVEEETKIQTMPPGFHAIYMPYADDFRQITHKTEAKASEEATELFKKVIKKLTTSYNPEDFKNPALQKLWFEIEALALARESTEELIDLTEPNVERIEGRIGKYLREYVEMFNLTDVGSGKRKAAPNGESAAAKKAKTGDEAIDVAAEARAGRLEKLTVPILKDFIKDKKISAKGTKKEDLVKSIKTFLKI